jgi:hypothetical protein
MACVRIYQASSGHRESSLAELQPDDQMVFGRMRSTASLQLFTHRPLDRGGSYLRLHIRGSCSCVRELPALVILRRQHVSPSRDH